MKIKRIKKLKVNSYDFVIVWDAKKHCSEGGINYTKREMFIGVEDYKDKYSGQVFETLCHELWELVAIEMHVRFQRPDVDCDYLFVYDHRQHDTMVNMFAGLLGQFIK